VDSLDGGSQGVVQQIKHEKTGEPLVWKKTPVKEGKEKTLSPEVDVGLKIKSPYLVPTLDTFVKDFERYNVMKFYSGGNLRQFLVNFAALPIDGKRYVSLLTFFLISLSHFFHWFSDSGFFSHRWQWDFKNYTIITSCMET
jgi:serine/threonine protein kinase